jgi:hypothetical protein
MAIKLVSYKSKRVGTSWSSSHAAFVGFQVDKRMGGRRHRLGPFLTKREAEDFVYRLVAKKRELKAGLKPVDSIEISLQQLIDARLASLTEPKRHVFSKRVLGRFLAIAGGATRIVDIRTSHLREYVDSRREDLTARGTAVKAATLKRELGVVTGTLNAAANTSTV